MLHHQFNNLVVREFAFAKAQFFVDRLAGAQQFARLDAHLSYQLTEFRLAERVCDVVDLLVINPALTEQAVGLATLASGRLFVDDDLVLHPRLPPHGNIPRTRVASATRPTARMYAPVRMSVLKRSAVE